MQGLRNREKTARPRAIEERARSAGAALLLFAFAALGAGEPADGRSCAKIESDAERLACYDRVFRDTEERFGSRKAVEPVDEPEELRARVNEAKRRSDGKFIVTLDNGQVWLQKEADNRQWFETGDEIVIRRGLLGSYRMGKVDSKRLTLVTRIN